jgi:hypothetical protein
MMLDLVGPGDVVVDIGAGAGLFSLCAAAAGCVVVAVEASPGDVARLRASVDRNGTRGMRVVHAVVAAADQIVSDQRAAGPAAAVTLEELVAQCGLPEVSVLRLGGADDAVPPIRAVSWLLDRTAAPAVIVHSEGPAACSLELLAGMENLGYSIFGVSPTGLVPAPSSGRGPRRPSLATKSPARLDRGATAVS